MNNIVISDNYLFKVEQMILGGKDDLLVMADFDRTLTKAFDSEGDKMSPGRLMRGLEVFQGKISEEIEDLYLKYKIIEADNKFKKREKIEALSDCYRRQMRIMVKAGFNKDMLKDLVDNYEINFRDRFDSFVDYLSVNKIPLIIVSAAWGDLIELYLKKEGCLKERVYVVSNFFKFERHGKAIGI